MNAKPVTTPTVVLELEGYFRYARKGIFYKNTPIDLLDFDESGDATQIELMHNDYYQYNLKIEGKKDGEWELMLDKTAYWSFANGIYISETPIRTDEGYKDPQIRLNLAFDSKKKYHLTWTQLP